MFKPDADRFTPSRADYEHSVRRMFDAMPIHRTIGITLGDVLPGQASATISLSEAVMQHHRSMHAGALITLADCVCGCAAWSLIGTGEDLVSSNITATLLRRADAPLLQAIGRVIKPGKRLYFCEAVIGDALDTQLARPFCIVQVTIALV